VLPFVVDYVVCSKILDSSASDRQCIMYQLIALCY
jgi:hypothetical protein